MPQFNPHNYMDPNPGYRTYNGEYYLYTPTKTQDWSWGASGIGGKVEKLTPEQVKQYGLNANNTYNAVISPEQWVANAAWTQQDFQSGIQNAFGGFDKNNTTGWQGKMNELVSQAQSLYNQDPSQGDKVFGTVWNNFRNSNLPAIQNLQAQNNPARPEFTSQTQAGMYGQTGQLMNQDQINAYARNGGQPQQSQPVYTGPTTTRLNPQTGLLEKVPASSVLADQLPLAVSKTITPDQLTNSTNTAGLFPSIANGSAGAQTVLNVGNLGLSALDQALLQFNAQQQELAASQRSQAETALAQAQQGLANVYNTSREGEIARILQEAGIKEKQAALSDLKVKMAQAQEALGLGMQQENGRIAPMSIIGRRQQLLVEQAQGKIGALAAIANVYADDLDQAWNVANLTIDAMNQDRQEKIDAYKFLITANENKIVNLKAEEKEAINSQITILKEAQAKAEANKNKVMELITKNPIEAQKAKVSLTDTYEQAMAKIQPLVAKRAETEYALQMEGAKLDVQYKKAQIANIQSEIANRGGGNKGNLKIVNINGTDYVQNADGTFSVPVIKGQAINSVETAKLKDKIALANNLIKSPGLNSSVGTNWAGRIGLLDKVTGAKQDFIAGVQQLSNQETLSSLLELKKAGGTLGALNESEGQMLRDSATKINNWAIKDKDGKVTGYNANEKSFKEELGRLKTLSENALTRASGANGLVDNLEQNLARNPQRIAEYNSLVKANPGITEDQINQLMGF